MQTYTLDCEGITNPRDLHRALAETLHFPSWYGHNLDALMDCLTELETPTQLRLLGWNDLGQWKDGFTQALIDASLDNPTLTVIL